MTKKFIQVVFDDHYIGLMTRCIAELILHEERHPKFKHVLN